MPGGQRRFLCGHVALDDCSQVDQARGGDRTEVLPLPVDHVAERDAHPQGGGSATPDGQSDLEVHVEHSLGRSGVAGRLPRLAPASHEIEQGEHV